MFWGEINENSIFDNGKQKHIPWLARWAKKKVVKVSCRLDVPVESSSVIYDGPKKEQNCSLTNEQICSSACKPIPMHIRDLKFAIDVPGVIGA